MQIDRTKIYFMPLIRGPLWDQNNLPKHNYASVESLMLQYETDPDAIPPLLPEPFKPGKSPNVTVMFADNNGVDFMAGRGYRFDCRRFDPGRDSTVGRFCSSLATDPGQC